MEPKVNFRVYFISVAKSPSVKEAPYLTIEVRRAHTIQRVKRIIEEKSGIPVAQQSLFKVSALIQGRIQGPQVALEDGHRLSDYGPWPLISPSITVQGVPPGRVFVEDFTVDTRISGKSYVLCAARTTMMVAELKGRFEAQSHSIAQLYRLVRHGTVLKDDQPLGDGSLVSAHLLSQLGNVQIRIKTLAGAVLKLGVRLSSTIEVVKTGIRDMEGIPVEQQRLIFGGNLLEDHRLLCEYGIMEGSELHLVHRLRTIGSWRVLGNAVQSTPSHALLSDDSSSLAVLTAQQRLDLIASVPSSTLQPSFPGTYTERMILDAKQCATLISFIDDTATRLLADARSDFRLEVSHDELAALVGSPAVVALNEVGRARAGT